MPFPGKQPNPLPPPDRDKPVWYQLTGPGSEVYAKSHWNFLKEHIVAKERKSWMRPWQAPFAISPEATYGASK